MYGRTEELGTDLVYLEEGMWKHAAESNVKQHTSAHFKDFTSPITAMSSNLRAENIAHTVLGIISSER